MIHQIPTDEAAGVCESGVQEQAGALEGAGGEDDDTSLDLHFAVREAIDEVAAVNQAGVLVNGEFADDGVGDRGELAGLFGRRAEAD